jgi:uncharacterized membrane protein YbhN (UPF0104 family)
MPPKRAGSLQRAVTKADARTHFRRSFTQNAAVLVVAGALAGGAAFGVAWVAGFGAVAHVALHAHYVWLPVALAGLIPAYAGYIAAHRAVARVEGGPELRWTHSAAVVAAGFGAFAVRGGFAVDVDALRRAGATRREARVRTLGLGALEYAILAPAACGAAIFLLVRAAHISFGLTLPWAIAVPIGFAVALPMTRYRERLRRRGGLASALAHGLDAVAVLRDLSVRLRTFGAAAFVGMAAYWLGDIFVLWATLHAFLGRPPPVATLVIGYATGYVLTRRTLPLAGAGAVEALVPFALHWTGYPLAASLLAVVAYRIANLWLPLIPALLGLRAMRHAFEHDDGTKHPLAA